MGLMGTDKAVHLNNTLNKDVFIDSAIWMAWFAGQIFKLPDFVRKWMIYPLIQKLISSEILPGNIVVTLVIILRNDQNDDITFL